MNVSEIKPGDPVQAVFLVSTAEVRETRRGDPYLRMSLRDRSGGSIDALFFGASETDISLVTAGKPFEIDGEADEFRNRVNIKVNTMRPSSETWDASAHLPRSKHSAEVLRFLQKVVDVCSGEKEHEGGQEESPIGARRRTIRAV